MQDEISDHVRYFLKSQVLRLVSFCCIVVAVTFLASCEWETLGASIAEQTGDGGLLSEDTCSAPCFWGITPGETTKEQVVEILEQKNGSYICETNTRLNILSCRNSLSIGFDRTDYVKAVCIYLSSAISVEEVIEKYGAPYAVEVICDDIVPDRTIFDMRLFYDEIYAAISLQRQETWPDYDVERETLVSYVCYFDENTYFDTLASNKYLTEWIGYGSYSEPENGE